MIANELTYGQGQATDIQIQAEEILKLKKQLNMIYSNHCEKPLELIGTLLENFELSGILSRVSWLVGYVSENSMERDRYMSPAEAKEFGLIDHVRDEYISSWFSFHFFICGLIKNCTEINSQCDVRIRMIDETAEDTNPIIGWAAGAAPVSSSPAHPHLALLRCGT